MFSGLLSAARIQVSDGVRYGQVRIMKTTAFFISKGGGSKSLCAFINPSLTC